MDIDDDGNVFQNIHPVGKFWRQGMKKYFRNIFVLYILRKIQKRLINSEEREFDNKFSKDTGL